MTSTPMRNVGRVYCAALLIARGSKAQTLEGPALARALQAGGYVIVMRHASSPQAPPTSEHADPGNLRHERQLDAAGRTSAAAMGQAMRAMHIRIGEVWSSPTFRALETVRLAGLRQPTTAPELGDQGHSMQAVSADEGAWLRARVDQPPKPGTDTLIVTHSPNLTAAFGQAAAGMTDGEGLVLQPDSAGPAKLVARIGIEDWASLAAAAAAEKKK